MQGGCCYSGLRFVGPASKISDIIATCSVIANPGKQQIPIRLRSGQALHYPFDSFHTLRVRSG
jgi:hypothetical protein